MTDFYKDLVERNGFYYRNLSDVPFSGKVTGLRNGLMKNGKFDGEWVGYWEDVQLMWKGNYKNGKREGEWLTFSMDGQLYGKDYYKNGVKISD